MDDSLISPEVPERKSILPGEGFFVPDSVRQERAEAKAAERLTGAEVVVIADPDADGLAAAALIRAVHGSGELLPTGPHEIETGLRRAAEYLAEDALVYVCDLCPDSPDAINALGHLVDRAVSVRWFDHHQWNPAVAASVRDAGVNLVVGDSETECTADVTLEELDGDIPSHLADLVAATRDHDLWIRDDPRSNDLADYAHWVDPETYVETVSEHGADLPVEARELLTERRVEKDDFIERAVRRAEYRDIGSVCVGVTYGRCSQNEVAEAMRDAGAEASVIVKPTGSASIRGTDGFERCHEVARLVNGGGHPKAAGCKPEIYDDILDYAHHWVTRGATAKQVILSAFQTIIESDDAA